MREEPKFRSQRKLSHTLQCCTLVKFEIKKTSWNSSGHYLKCMQRIRTSIMSLNVLQPLQHVSHRGAHTWSLQDSVNANCVCVLLVDPKHLSHVAADRVTHLEEGSSEGRSLTLGNSWARRRQVSSSVAHWHLDHMVLCGGAALCTAGCLAASRASSH